MKKRKKMTNFSWGESKGHIAKRKKQKVDKIKDSTDEFKILLDVSDAQVLER